MCRLILLLALAAALLTAETASAAPFVPQASLALDHPDCVAATGAPGELVRSVADPTQRMALLHAGPDGIAAGQQVTFGDPPDALAIPHDCVSVSARPDGSGIAAAAAHAAGRRRFSITLAHARGVRFVTLGVLPWSRRYATTREIRVG